MFLAFWPIWRDMHVMMEHLPPAFVRRGRCLGTGSGWWVHVSVQEHLLPCSPRNAHAGKEAPNPAYYSFAISHVNTRHVWYVVRKQQPFTPSRQERPFNCSLFPLMRCARAACSIQTAPSQIPPSHLTDSKGITENSTKKRAEHSLPRRDYYRSGLSRPTPFLSVNTLRRTSYDVSLCSLSSGLLLGLLMAASTMAGGRNSKPRICSNIGHGRIRSDERNSTHTVPSCRATSGPIPS